MKCHLTPHLEHRNTVTLTDKLIWFPIQSLYHLGLRNWTDASPMKNCIQPAADTSLVIPKARTVDSLQCNNKVTFLLKPKYQFWQSPTCKHAPCLRREALQALPSPHSTEQPSSCLPAGAGNLLREGFPALTCLPRAGRTSLASFSTGEQPLSRRCK